MHVEKPANPLPQGEYMGAEQTEFFRKLLLEKHADLSQRISDHVKGMQVQERVSDDLDKAALEHEHSVGIRLLDRLRVCIPVMLPTGSSDCDPPVLEVLPSHSSGCDPLRRRSCPIPKACRCVIART